MTLTEELQTGARDLNRRIRPRVRQATRRLDTLNDDVIDYVRDNPVKCLLGAVALGVVIGKLASR